MCLTLEPAGYKTYEPRTETLWSGTGLENVVVWLLGRLLSGMGGLKTSNKYSIFHVAKYIKSS